MPETGVTDFNVVETAGFFRSGFYVLGKAVAAGANMREVGRFEIAGR
jgi:hypothetical protein